MGNEVKNEDKTKVKTTTTIEQHRVDTWPKANDNEFSKRMFIQFMCAFFVHILITVVAEAIFPDCVALEILSACIPVYTTIFAAVIVKGGVENVFKGKTYTTTTTTTDNG